MTKSAKEDAMMTDAFQSRFHSALTDLMEDRGFATDDVRATAVTTLSDLVLESAQVGEARLPEHFDELMQSLLPRVPAKVRAGLSRRLAHCDVVPAGTVRLLAKDEMPIAGPILRQSPVLSEDDLVEIASGSSAEKARAIAARADLTAKTVSALVDRQDPVISAALALSSAHAIDETMAERIARTPDLPRVAAQQLIELADLSDAVLAQLFWLVESDARHRILDRIARRRRDESGTSHTHASREDAGTFGETLFALAAAGERREIASRLSGALDLPRAVATRLVDDPLGESLAVAMRAAGLEIERITGFLLLTVSEAGRSYDVLRTLIGLAEAVEPETAAYVVGLWRMDGETIRPTIRHEPAVARPSDRHKAGQPARRLEDIVTDIGRRTGS